MSKNTGLFLTAAAVAFLATTTVQADERYNPIQDPVVAQECGACHMAFPPQMLPGKSWDIIMGELSNHFGEDASLDLNTTAHIKEYHLANAADSGLMSGKFMRGLSKTDAPLRITETPYWIRKHKGEVSQQAWTSPKVKSKANCIACHRGANKGYYDDD